jgi:glycosyl transferase, family 25
MAGNQPPLSIFAINLAGSTARWAALSEALARHAPAARLHRVEAVDGRIVPPEAREGFDRAEFERRNGRICLGGEYGCYRSHIAVYDAIAREPAPICAVLEDDASFRADSLRRIEAIIPIIEKLGPEAPVLVKLVNHRSVFFRPFARTAEGDRIGRAAHGPSGSSAAYLITPAGARVLRRTIEVMREPLDIAIEAGWRSELIFLSVDGNVVGLGGNEQPSTIGPQTVMRKTKFPKWRRIPCYLHRSAEYLRRALYAFRRIG